MLTIDTEGRHKNRLTLTRGDSAALKLKVRDARNKPLTLADGDSATLTIKKTIYDEEPVLSLAMDADGQFVFKPEDTASLEPGNYCYDVQVILSTGHVYTVISPALFVLEKGVS